MVEEGFVQLYVRDFAAMAARSDAGQDVEEALARRVRELKSHAELMDRRKTPGHQAAVVERLITESERTHVRHGRIGPDDTEALERRRDFLLRVAAMLREDAAELAA